MRALGIDFGERRIGLSLSDPDGRLAVPIEGLERTTDRRAVYRIADLVRSEAVEVLVLGEPGALEESGAARDEHPAAERIRRFGTKLERATGLPLVRVDETLTTVEADERLRAAGSANRAPRTVAERAALDRRRDALAAQILLQEALDRGLESLVERAAAVRAEAAARKTEGSSP